MINKYNELTQYVPKRYWGNDEVQKLIYEKLTDRLNWLEGIFEEIVNNAYIKDMNEEALTRIEKEFKIKSDSEMTLEERKEYLLSILRGIGVTNIERLKIIAKSYDCGDIEVIQNYSSYSIIIKFVSVKGIPKRVNDLKKAIEKVIPCHLGVSYEFIYNTVHYLRQYTVRELRQYTVEELRTEELNHLGLSKKYLRDENGNNLVDKEGNKLIAFSQDLVLFKKHLTDENGNKLVDRENNKLNTFD